jgi:hypothetical protein
MPASDFEIHRAAYLYSNEATARAREMVERMRRGGDHDGADTWLRIIVAIGEFGEPGRLRRGTDWSTTEDLSRPQRT